MYVLDNWQRSTAVPARLTRRPAPVGVCVADTLQLHLPTQLLMRPQASRQLRSGLVIEVCQHTLAGTDSLQEQGVTARSGL